MQPEQQDGNGEAHSHLLNGAERRDLHEALERCFQDNPGAIMDAPRGKRSRGSPEAPDDENHLHSLSCD